MRLSVRPALLLLIGAITCSSGLSCNQHSTASKQTATTNAKPGPEESFNQIIEIFRRRVEETPVGFVVSDPSGRSTLTGQNQVSHELIKPANENEPYKAIVTVASQSRYWVNRTREKENSDETDRDKEGEATDENQPTDPKDEKNSNSFDSAQIVKSGSDSSKSRVSSITGERTTVPSEDGEVRKYELVYQGGKWQLVTKLNMETEQSIQNAFQNALDTQL